MKAKTILFLLSAIVCVACENNINVKDYGEYNVIGNTYVDEEAGLENNGEWYYGKVTVSFDETNISYYENDSLCEKTPYKRIDKTQIEYTSKVNGNVTIEVHSDRVYYEFIGESSDKDYRMFELMKKQ